MWYIIEMVEVQTHNELNKWSKSIKILGVDKEHWRALEYFNRIWKRYKAQLTFESFVKHGNSVTFFGDRMSCVTVYITQHPFFDIHDEV